MSLLRFLGMQGRPSRGPRWLRLAMLVPSLAFLLPIGGKPRVARAHGLEELLGREEEELMKSFGEDWRHFHGSRADLLTVEGCLGLLNSFDALAHDEARARRQREYGLHTAVLDDVQRPIGLGATATRIWSKAPMKFWSVAVCRTEDGALEKIDDHHFVAHLLPKGCQLTEEGYVDGENWTLIFNKLHGATADMGALHHALWACFGVSGDFNVYLTPPSSQGLAPHVDNHDVLVAQQAGEKTWRLGSDMVLVLNLFDLP